jgi:thiosulfate/3-mercaptopyruvate sulfurtransferase
MAELAGHPNVAVLLGGMAAWEGELAEGAVELEPLRESQTEFQANLGAMPTRQEIASRLGDESLVLLDIRTPDEFTGRRGAPCDPRQGHIPGARLVDLGELLVGPGQPAPPEQIRELVGLPEGAEVVAYCHSGSRSALAALALRAAGYEARNYPGSWHEWSRHDELPLER